MTARVEIRETLQTILGICSIGWHQMHDPSVYLTSSGVRSRVLERDPSKGYGFAPYIIYMIEKVIGHTFEYGKPHKVLKIVVDL